MGTCVKSLGKYKMYTTHLSSLSIKPIHHPTAKGKGVQAVLKKYILSIPNHLLSIILPGNRLYSYLLFNLPRGCKKADQAVTLWIFLALLKDGCNTSSNHHEPP